MGLAEGDAFAHEIVGHFRGVQEAAAARLLHALRVVGKLGEHAFEDGEGSDHRVGGVKETLLILLKVAVIREGQAFHDGEQAHEGAVDPASLAAHELGHVRIFLLGHDGRARGVAVRKGDKAEIGIGPVDGLLAVAGEVLHDEGSVEEGLEHKVAVRYGVQGIVIDAVEAHVLCHALRIEGVGGAGQGGGPER